MQEEERMRLGYSLSRQRRGRRDEDGETLADKVFAWLTEQIISGALRPGQWVSENELAETFGVSRSPVREALIGLAHDGLVEVRPGRGTIIAELDPREAEDLYRTRQLADAELVRLAIEEV